MKVGVVEEVRLGFVIGRHDEEVVVRHVELV
jgi:hypothetical protein